MKTLTSASVLFLALGLAATLSARPFTNYCYLTDLEVTEFGEIIWFWTPDTLYGRTHSNDYIGLRYSPTFYGPVSTSKSEFRYYQPGNIHFEYEPVFNAPRAYFPRSFSHLRRWARAIISDDNGRLMTVMRFRGEQGIYVYQYPLGMPPEDSLVAHIENRLGQILYIDGKLDMEGIVSGRVTVSASGDIGLLDDLRYLGSDEHTGRFDQDTTTSMLAVVSEGNIIIRDTYPNGRANGYDEEPQDWGRHSIVLNGSYIALDESFEIEHQNDDWDRYQGPTPDERGNIYLTGSLAQRRRGYTHRANHTGTGYRSFRRFDFRLERFYPTGLSPEECPEYDGNYDFLVYENGSFTIWNKSANKVVIEAGTEIDLPVRNALAVNDSLFVRGTAQQPVRIYSSAGIGGITARIGCFVSIEHAIFESGIELNAQNANVSIRNSRFVTTPLMSGTIRLDSCSFDSRDDHLWSGNVTVTRTAFNNCGIVISGRNSTLELINSTIAGSNQYGVKVLNTAQATLVNCIVAFNRYGIFTGERSNAEVRYCDVAENSMVNYYDCQPGEGCFSADPQFFDLRSGDLRLTENSPCIDTGDPTSPRDPDGTVADLGAFWLDRGLDMEEDNPPFNSPPASRGGKGLTASPNPFNATTVIRFEGSLTNREATVRIFDLAGREVFNKAVNPPLASGVNPPRLTPNESAADHGGSAAGILGGGSAAESFVWDAFAYPAGIYIARIDNGIGIHSIKLLKVN